MKNYKQIHENIAEQKELLYRFESAQLSAKKLPKEFHAAFDSVVNFQKKKLAGAIVEESIYEIGNMLKRFNLTKEQSFQVLKLIGSMNPEVKISETPK